ncbi:MAG: hypothetical protein HY943_09820 [Gammaproteobacteria bacterium]|nr:hypothetical protein [Gammaproteobacteria bacterium]
MSSQTLPPRNDAVITPRGDAPHVDLPAIIAGALLSAAVALLFTTFGSGIGLSMLSPYRGEGTSGTMFLVAFGLWTIWVAVSSAMAGGYLAGRLRRRTADATPHEVEVRDGFHGLAVWALAALIGAWLAAGATAGVAKMGAGAARGAMHAGAQAAGQHVGGMMRGMMSDMQGTTGQDDFGATADRLVRAPQDGSPREVARILSRSAAAGQLSAEDRQYLVDVVAARTNRTPEEAGQIVDRAFTDAQQALAHARDAAEKARKAGILFAFLTAASLLAAGVGAWWAATRGGLHRDQNTDFSRLTRWA